MNKKTFLMVVVMSIFAVNVAVFAQTSPSSQPPSELALIKYILSRAGMNLENMGPDPSGHYAKALEYLKKASEEIDQIPQ